MILLKGVATLPTEIPTTKYGKINRNTVFLVVICNVLVLISELPHQHSNIPSVMLLALLLLFCRIQT